MPLVATRGAASAQGFGEFGAVTAVNYIEDVFSTYLYTGNGSTQTITNGIDLSGKGGLVWVKVRGPDIRDHALADTQRGPSQILRSSSSSASQNQTFSINAFNSNGFSVGGGGDVNFTNNNICSWTFREQAKFFDVVTYTGNGANRTIAHNLGSVPGCIMVKRTDTTADWQVYHRSLANTEYMVLNDTAAKATGTTRWNSTTPTSTVFSLGTDTTVNANGGTYVAYLFAHNAGGFGLTGTDNVISCGSYTGNGAATGPEVNLGWEPQWLLVKDATNSGYYWQVVDNMRGIVVSGNDAVLYPNVTDAEAQSNEFSITSTGFFATRATNTNVSGATYIYIAIRRGPMKVPTSGTSVFGLNARTGTGANATVTGGQVDDAVLIKNRGSAVGDLFAARLTGTGYLETSSTAAEVAAGTTILQANPWDVMDGVKVGTTSTITNASSNTFINYLFRRAPGFFDVVAYTGTGLSSALTVSHNLGSAPELIIIKRRDVAGYSWVVGTTFTASTFVSLFLNDTSANAGYSGYGTIGYPFASKPTSTSFAVGTDANVNSAGTFVAYLFATVPGVSKVGSYTGTGALQTIDCGFTSGARFVLIKRTDTTGDWWVYDSTRGITSGNDPYFFLNSTAAEVTNTNYVDTDTTGFKVTAAAPAGLNANGGTYIFLAVS